MPTFPMRARKSQSSIFNQATTGLNQSLTTMKHAAKVERRKYIFSIGLFVFTIMGLVVGTFGQFGEQALAQENNRSYWNGRSERLDRNNNSSNTTTKSNTASKQTNSNKSSTTTTTSDSSKKTTTPAPAQTRSSTTPPPSSSTTTQVRQTTQESTSTVAPAPQSAPARTSTVRSVATTPAPEPAVAANTATEISTMTAAQATDTSAPVTYTSQQISTETRNRLLALAVSAASSGIIIYLMSLFATNGGASVMTTRYRIPVHEVVTN